MKKITKTLLISCGIFSLCSCSNEHFLKKPDYSQYNDTMDFYAYCAANDGTLTYDGTTSVIGPSLLTKEQFQMYKDCGLNIFFPQSKAIVREESDQFPTLREESWEKARLVVDTAVEAGLERTLLYDQGLSWLGLKENDTLVGEGEDYEFHSNEELDAKVLELISLYKDYPGVYGITLADEPAYKYLKSYAEVYHSLLRINETLDKPLYIQYNLNPFIMSENVFNNFYPYVEGTDEYNFENSFTRYKKYLNDYLDLMDPDYVQYDSYPMKAGSIGETYMPCLQYVAGVARDRGINFHNVTQTFAMLSGLQPSYREVEEMDARWMNNMLLSFGVDQISYFTYFTHDGGTSAGETFVDNTAMVDNYGNKTYLYDIMKKIIGEDQQFAHVYKRFDYMASDIAKKPPFDIPCAHINNVIKDGNFTALKEYSVDKEAALITELYDSENDFYMYGAMNVVDPSKKGSKVFENITLKFDSKYKYALVYRNGEGKYYRLDSNSSLKIKAAPGDGSFVIPFN